MKSSKTIMTAILLGIAMSATSCGATLPENTLVVGLECGYAPFNWTQSQSNDYTLPISGLKGQYADGYDVAMAKYLGQQLHYDVQIRKIVWDSLIASLRNNHINVIIAGMSNTEERIKQIDFTEAYYTSEIVGIVRANSDLTSFTNIQQLGNYRVVSQLGTVQDTIINQINNVKHQTGVESFSDGALMVNSGNADCLILEKPVATQITANYPSLQMIQFTDGNFTGLNEDELSVSIGVKKGNTELCASINTALSNLTSEQRKTMMDEAIARSVQ